MPIYIVESQTPACWKRHHSELVAHGLAATNGSDLEGDNEDDKDDETDCTKILYIETLSQLEYLAASKWVKRLFRDKSVS